MIKRFSQFIAVILITILTSLPLVTIPVSAENNPTLVADFSDGYSAESLEIKFTPNSGVIDENENISGDADKIQKITDIIGKNNIKKSKKLFKTTKEKTQSNNSKAKLATGKAVPSLENYIKIELKTKVDMAEVVTKLEKLDFIENAFPTALPTESPSVTPDYNSNQKHLREIGGLNADFSFQIDGGTGKNVKIADLEYSWNINHEDLSTVETTDKYLSEGYEDPFYDDNHGTAVASLLVGNHNKSGVNGIVPEAELKLFNTYNNINGWELANTIYSAVEHLNPGDVILLEQQANGPMAGSGDFVPVEIIPSVYDAIVTATALGIHVIEPAGNGNQNLDNATYFGTTFPFGKPNSGALIVGASDSCSATNPDSRAYFSTYGSRVDVYANGGCVVSAGYGYLYNPGDVNKKYSNIFGGTSSASAIVAGSVASISSASKEIGSTLIPTQMLNSIKSTGLMQGTSTAGNIGKKPQIRKAIFANGPVKITSCYTGGWGENFFLHIAKNHFNRPTPADTQKYSIEIFGSRYAKNKEPNPIAFTETGTKCYTSSYNSTEILNLDNMAKFTVLDYSAAQAYSGILLGALIVFWGL